jgi:phage terminase small subunit
MPARKDSSLNRRHDSKKDILDRESAENALKPTTKLSAAPPLALDDHPHARKIWKRTIKLYTEIQGEIITAFDEDLLIKYCLAEGELLELQGLRKAITKLWDQHSKWLAKLKPTNENLKNYFNALNQANALLKQFQGMDARLDGKRKMLLTMEQSLYLTPRSRAGVAPPERPEDEPDSEMDKLLKG